MKGIENIGVISSKKCRNGFKFFFWFFFRNYKVKVRKAIQEESLDLTLKHYSAIQLMTDHWVFPYFRNPWFNGGNGLKNQSKQGLSCAIVVQ